MEKLVVIYDTKKDVYIKKGGPAIVWPINHTSVLVSNLKPILTSEVLRYDHNTGEFETLNSIYKPKKF